MATLRRLSDGEGEQGARSEAIYFDPKGKKDPQIKGNRPTVGCCMLVGSVSARTYSERDWWMTTPVIEIIEDKGDYVKFRTKNSTYEWTI